MLQMLQSVMRWPRSRCMMRCTKPGHIPWTDICCLRAVFRLGEHDCLKHDIVEENGIIEQSTAGIKPACQERQTHWTDRQGCPPQRAIACEVPAPMTLRKRRVAQPRCHCWMMMTLMTLMVLIWWGTPWEVHIALVYRREDNVDGFKDSERWNPSIPASQVKEEVDHASGHLSVTSDGLRVLMKIIAPQRRPRRGLRGALASWKEQVQRYEGEKGDHGVARKLEEDTELSAIEMVGTSRY